MKEAVLKTASFFYLIAKRWPLLIIFILGIFTYAKNILQLNQKIYFLFVFLILFSYVIYIMYIYDFMFMKDSIDKILNYIKYGKFFIFILI